MIRPKIYLLLTILILVIIVIKVQCYFKSIENFAYGINCLNNKPFHISDNTIIGEQNGDYHYLRFTHKGVGNETTYTLTLYNDVLCDILIVGGGGGGGKGDSKYYNKAGGGGGGGVVYMVNQTLNAGTYKINVGRGGHNTPDNGKDSSIKNFDDSQVIIDGIELIGKGGGFGQYSTGRGYQGVGASPGGSGGGSNRHGQEGIATQNNTFWDSTLSQYVAGGHNGTRDTSRYGSYPFGGGGAGGIGIRNAGGIGRMVNITNQELYFGGGGNSGVSAARGGSQNGNPGMPDTGEGGGGGYRASERYYALSTQIGGAGGSGIVIIKIND